MKFETTLVVSCKKSEMLDRIVISIMHLIALRENTKVKWELKAVNLWKKLNYDYVCFHFVEIDGMRNSHQGRDGNTAGKQWKSFDRRRLYEGSVSDITKQNSHVIFKHPNSIANDLEDSLQLWTWEEFDSKFHLKELWFGSNLRIC